jgi:hypothetical protein
MRPTALIRTRPAAIATPGQLLSLIVGANTALLLALDRLGAIPSWVKLAAALFLEF